MLNKLACILAIGLALLQVACLYATLWYHMVPYIILNTVMLLTFHPFNISQIKILWQED